MNKLVYIVNKIFSILFKIIKWIRTHWFSLRKVLVIFLILGGLVYQFSLPDVRKKINDSTTNIILQYEQDAISLKKDGKLSAAIDSYKNAIAIITSRKELSYLDIDDDVKYRIYKNAAILILDYSKSYKLTESQKRLLPILFDALSTYQNNSYINDTPDRIISDIKILISANDLD